MTLHSYMVHVPVNTSGNETMIEGVRRRLKEMSEADDVQLVNTLDIFKKV
ncbi:MAG: hypothetical protein WC932_02440 [archaeon]